MRLLILAVLPAVRAGEYDSCGRPDAIFASWDQVDSLRHAQPRSLLPPGSPPPPRSLLIANHAAWTGQRQVVRLRRY